MIKKIVLKNVESHQRLTLNLKSGFNCVMGSNNFGKSAVLRAFYWLAHNSPRGDWMCKKDKNGKTHTASVKVVKGDGTVIKRIRGKKQNKYVVINGKTCEENIYEDVGTNVPAEVTEALGFNDKLSDVHKDLAPYFGDEVPYLVKRTSSTLRAQAINVLTGVNKAEKLIKEFNKDKLSHNKTIKYNKGKIKENLESLEKYQILFEIDLKEIENIYSIYDDKKAKVENLLKLKGELADNKKIIDGYKFLSEYYNKIREAEKICDTLVGMREAINDLEKVKSNIDSLKKYDNIKIEFDVIENKIKTNDELRSKIEALVDLKDNLDDNRDTFIKLKASVGRKRAQLSKLDGATCPFCNNTIEKGKLLNG